MYGTELPLEPAFASQIKAHPKSEIIAGIFSVSQSSVAQDLLVNLPDFIKAVDYQDLFRAFEIMETDALAIYYYRGFLSEIFGIDVAKMTENQVRSNSKPSDWSQEYLSDRNIDQNQLLQRMQQQGAPMI